MAAVFGVIAGLGPAATAFAQPEQRKLNGFVIDPTAIRAREIRSGGVPRDRIPALTDPKVAPASDFEWKGSELVIGVEIGGEARAYPFAVLVWHELVNDTLGGTPILVSYCPLCGTGIVFERKLGGGRIRNFGVSGLLYRSDLLMYDHETESLWSQISAEAVTGRAQGGRLRQIRSRIVPWKTWLAEHPETTALTSETGHERNYRKAPYRDYATSDRVRFGAPRDRRYHPKLLTLGLRLAGGAARGYPADEVEKAGGRVEEEFKGRKVAVTYDSSEHIFRVEAPGDVEVIEGYWFAWAAFHPEASVFTAEPPSP
jgi:hypothetical protein